MDGTAALGGVVAASAGSSPGGRSKSQANAGRTLDSRVAGNAVALAMEFDWLAAVVAMRMKTLSSGTAGTAMPQPPDLLPEDSCYADTADRLRLAAAERLVLALALAPHVRPQALDLLLIPNTSLGRGYTEVGGLHGRAHGGFMPTGETAMFLLAGLDLRARLEHHQVLARESTLGRHGLVHLEAPPHGEPPLSGALVMSDEVAARITTGAVHQPEFGHDFPAKALTTALEWNDLVLSPSTREQLQELTAWVQHRAALRQTPGLGRRIKGGYRALFYGPPGTGKTLTAALLGKHIGCEVYRVALSAVVSKYIGETEKNLERVFGRAERMECILFFDEADALFGRRSATTNAHDRYANQEISYLLQRLEDYQGLVILASNLEGNIDEAFMRRFQAVVHFPSPSAAERLRLWRDTLPPTMGLERGVSLEQLARDVELAGGSILNIVHYAVLMAIEARSNIVRRTDLLAGVRRELQKEGRSL